jgi:hypothetical protein
MPEIALTPSLRRKLAALFSSEDQAFAERWLTTECGEDIPGGAPSPEALERIRAAALKVSAGSLERLARATKLARSDWRDILMAAGFGDLEAHKVWLSD